MASPLTLGDMRAEGVRSVMVDCRCGNCPTVNVDALPDHLPVPKVRERLRCSRCGARPERTMPDWSERTNVPGIPDKG